MLDHPGVLRGKISVTFNGSHGTDAGGLTSELYTKLWEAIVEPTNGLFDGSGADGSGAFHGTCRMNGWLSGLP